jgi:hypothetical protein
MRETAICRIIAVTIIFTLRMVLPAYAGERVVDSARGFTLSLPDGFVPIPKPAGASPDIAQTFVLGDQTDNELDIILFVEEMNGTLGRERLQLKDLPTGFEGRLFRAQWQGFEVDAFEVPENLGDIKMLTFNVQIPLKREAIQIRLFGPAAREAELKSLLPEILAGLAGESNWIGSAAPNIPVNSTEHYGTILLAFASVFILVGLVVLFMVSRYAPRGMVFAAAAVIYCLGLAMAGVRVREFLMLGGALKLLGFAGGILGVIDIVRKRKPRAQDGPV